jgi:hypothetical protein
MSPEEYFFNTFICNLTTRIQHYFLETEKRKDIESALDWALLNGFVKAHWIHDKMFKDSKLHVQVQFTQNGMRLVKFTSL